jgi:uncharacterized FlgJ-related protein
MGSKLDLSSTHFRQMRKHLASIEKAYGENALVTIKNELFELWTLTTEIEEVVKNQLYRNLESVEASNDTEKNNQGRGTTGTD